MILCLILCVNQISWAFTERYIDFANGTDDTDCGNSEVNACKTIEYYIDKVDAPVLTAGDRVNIQWIDATYTQTLTNSIDLDSIDGTLSARIAFQGYSSTIEDGTQAIIDGDSAAVNIFNATLADYYIFKDLELKGSTGVSLLLGTNADYPIVENVKVTTSGGHSIDSNGLDTRIVNSNLSGSATAVDSVYAYVYKSYLHDCALGAFELSMLIDTIIDTTSSHSVHIDSDNDSILGCTFYNAGDDNVFIDTGEYGIILLDTILSTATNEEVDNDGQLALYGYNCLFTAGGATTAGGTILHNLGNEQLDVDPQFDDPGAADFNIGANLDDDGMPGQIGASTNTNEIGVLPYEETAGGGGATAHTFIGN